MDKHQIEYMVGLILTAIGVVSWTLSAIPGPIGHIFANIWWIPFGIGLGVAAAGIFPRR